MKKSKTIKLGLLAAIALTACSDSEVKHCVTEDGTVVDDAKCETQPESDAGALDDAGTRRAGTTPFRWFYGGTGGQVISPGSKINTSQGGGSFTPSPGRSYSTPGTISRGGFGGVGRGSPGA